MGVKPGAKQVKIHAQRVLTERGWLRDAVVVVKEGRFEELRRYQASDSEQPMIQAQWMLPALIDSHVHGGAGVDVMDSTVASLETLSLHLASRGVGAFLATTVTEQPERIIKALDNVAQAVRRGVPGATVLGSYLEGPYFTETHKGAHDSALFRELDCQELDDLIEVSQGTLKAVALAPEKANACTATRHLKQRGVNVMLAHTNATYQQTMAALDAGVDGIVHCFNGMSGLHHREPGVVGAALSDKRAYVELIADGHHVHPAAMKVCATCAKERLVLISDAMRAAGEPDGEYLLGDLPVQMKNGVVKTPTGGLAGSTLALIQGVRNMSQSVGVSIQKSVEYASLVPARMLGIDKDYGSIYVGKKANFLFVNDELELEQTWVDGESVWCHT
ncbi:N-acetylglucosamine-6-phosphate deacetylase [Vibrio albus]|uniref:N-acetylglucosamine-6-phosphate deacetylase n=1 Tax=Vibrio albus TaxID=2200953 RepID=A0A2U3B771_9VIBR|nr:N-acetylglucosamine-6-phosphate deacetylase [Vibrio albus]PWI32574.1 N-acetylglucosamine-6-phosphate deacetylase [Vibrio albus]